jgi:hypothetical protein
MSTIESSVQPSLIPMLHNEPCTLDAQAKKALSQWATLRILIAQLAHPAERRRTIPPERYKQFYEARSLPRGAQVWVGRYNGAGGWPTDYHHVELHGSAFGRPSPATPNGYLTAFSIGYAAFVYWGHEIENGPVVDIAGLAPYLIPIWPIEPAPAMWPPKGLLGANGLRAILKAFPIS